MKTKITLKRAVEKQIAAKKAMRQAIQDMKKELQKPKA